MDAEIAATAALIGDPARAKMLLALMGDLALPAGELAMCSNISPQTASSHLSKLLKAKLLIANVQGRNRYYRLASSEVASAIEALLAISPLAYSRGRREFEQDSPLRFARTCYNHLAGKVAVEINESLQKRALLVTERNKQYRLTEEGKRWFKRFGIGPDHLKAGRSGLARECLDWTERRHHLAGALGTAFLNRLLTLKWVVRMDKTRAVRITHKGREQLGELLGIEFSWKN
jgi:DNA-binding transcriptional ArsR family regulator